MGLLFAGRFGRVLGEVKGVMLNPELPFRAVQDVRVGRK